MCNRKRMLWLMEKAYLLKQVHSYNDASDDILGHFGTSWDTLGHFGTIGKTFGVWSLEHLDCFPSHFRPFSPGISSFKEPRDGRTDRTSYRDAWTHLKSLLSGRKKKTCSNLEMLIGLWFLGFVKLMDR